VLSESLDPISSERNSWRQVDRNIHVAQSFGTPQKTAKHNNSEDRIEKCRVLVYATNSLHEFIECQTFALFTLLLLIKWKVPPVWVLALGAAAGTMKLLP